jgi:hypothetical protein
MPDPVMPDEIRAWMDQVGWGMHHLQWHFVRQWDRQPPQARQWAQQQGWRRVEPQEGQPGNGFEFLAMHRGMLELLREQFKAHAALFAGWPTPPQDPADPNDPVPGGGVAPFDPDMARAIQRVEKNPQSFRDDDAFGLYLETRYRPTADNPFAQDSDPSTGVHNYVHQRFQDLASPVNMGNPQVNLGNQRFWRLHGWIDRVWSAVRRALGSWDDDPAFRSRIDAEKHHLMGHMARMRAAARAVAPPRPAGPAPVTVASPFSETLARRFHRLIATTPRPGNVDELKQFLQLAIQLEHFTIPLYLTALWSLVPGDAADGQRQILLAVVLEEMLHMGLAANLLTAIGGRPAINAPEAVPRYPDFLPGINVAHPFQLEAFSQQQVQRFLEIERPEHGPIIAALARAVPPARFPTIGDFYDAIDAALASLPLTFSAAGQRAAQIGTGELFVIRNRDDARRAVKLIKEQGEGTDISQGAVDFGGWLAHYYQFEQIVRQEKYVKQPDGGWKLDPAAPLPFPPAAAVYPMAPVPPGGYPGVPAAEAFDRAYTEVVNKLQEAWERDSDAALEDAVAGMYGLGSAARALMQTPRDPVFGPGNYGPAFRLLPPPPAGPAAHRVGL